MAYWNFQSQIAGSKVLRYCFSLVCFAIALGLALAFQHYQFREVEAPLFELAIAFTTWYAGVAPAVLTVVLSGVGFDYFFVEPLHSLSVSGTDLPYFLLFVAWAVIIASFAAVRRRTEADLRQALGRLQVEVEQRKDREDQIQKLNEELAKRATELETSNKELESFAYSVSHDLRAPLRHMAGFAELLRRNSAAALDEKSTRYLAVMLEAANRMGSLIDDLLGFSRISRAEAHYSAVSLGQIVQEAVAEVRRDADGRQIEWKIDSLPEWYGDRPMLRLAVVNLISNAVKFTRSRAEAKIEIGCTERNNDHLVLFVRDNGVGFDMKYSNKLFGVFQRLHSQEAFEGTGIGLATVQRIIHRHGGRVWAESIVGGGATFYFSLSKLTGAN